MHPELTNLYEHAKGLYYISESDHPFDAFELKSDADVVSQLKKLNPEAEEAMETVTLDHFFRNMVKVYEGASKEDEENAARFIKLKEEIHKVLKDVTVYRIGSIQIDAYITGKLTDGTIGGLHTKLVET